jgi:hypothetical protein
MKMIVAVSLLLLVSGGAVLAQIFPDEKVLQVLMTTRSLKCSFPAAATADWNSDEPRLRTSSEQKDFGFNIDAIDHKTHKARLIGNAGSDDLTSVAGDSSVSFIEVTPAGSINLTTVYAWRDKLRRFKAVHSRHVAIGGPSPSQNYGFCQVWE